LEGKWKDGIVEGWNCRIMEKWEIGRIVKTELRDKII
jgi:hypothetical protein